MSRPLLHDYHRSSAAYRTRIALNLKGVDYDRSPVDLADGAQKQPGYRELNPQGFVPMLEIDGHRLTQSLAIIDYLDARYPTPRLVPDDPADRACVLAMAMVVACDIHPLNNLRVLRYLDGPLGITREQRDEWYSNWIHEGFAALQKLARPKSGTWLFGDQPTVADVCLIPQIFNARRFAVPLKDYPLLRAVDETASAHPAFAAAHPDRIAKEDMGG